MKKIIMLSMFIIFGWFSKPYIIDSISNTSNIPKTTIYSTPDDNFNLDDYGRESSYEKDLYHHDESSIKNNFKVYKEKPTVIKHKKTTTSLSKFKCDHRKHCSQMHSYEEAKYFLSHCSNVKMDGDNDGIPCERQFGRYD